MTNPIEGLESALRDIVGDQGLIVRASEMEPYLIDWNGAVAGNARCVVRPQTTEETAKVLSLCAARGVPVVPQGGLTGMAAGATPLASGEEVIVNLSRMNRIIDVDPENFTIAVEAGCILENVKMAAEAVDRYFPLALGAQGSCEIGGNISTNAGGLNVLRYGSMRSAVLGIEVVLPDGSVLDLLRSVRKDNTGYDLKQLFIGAEGTLGIITKAVLQLYPRCENVATAWIALASLDDAVRLLSRMRSAVGERVSAFELISRPMLDVVLRHFRGSRDPLAERVEWYVLMEWSDTSTAFDLRAVMEVELSKCIEDGLVVDVALADSLAHTEEFWALRENISEAQRAEGAVVKHDISAPVSAVPRLIHEATGVVRRLAPMATVIAFGHVGDGNVHYNVVQPTGCDLTEFKTVMRDVSDEIYRLVAELGGSISAEHGLGQLKAKAAFDLKSQAERALMVTIKAGLDPQGIMNRGKLIPMDQLISG